MSIADKQIMINKLAANLGDTLTANQLTETMGIFSTTVSAFDISMNADERESENNNDLLDTFIAAKEIEGRSEKTTALYRYHINKLLGAVNVPIADINSFHIRKYLMDEKKRGVSDRTIEGIRSIFSSFFGWLNNEGLLANNPVKNIATVKCEKKVRVPLSEVSLEKLKEICDNMQSNGKRCTGTRNKALIVFLYSTGCRISEVCSLDRDSVDLTGMECIVHGKGNKERTVYLTPVAVMLLQRYLSERDDDSPALFVGRGSERLTPGGVRFMLKNLEKQTGIENVHPHRFRRTLATTLINHGMPIQDVANILGHESLNTTMKYVYQTKNKVKNSYQTYIY